MRIFNFITNYFLKGLSIVLPLSITFYLCKYALVKLNGIVCYVVEHIPYLSWTTEIPGLSLLITFSAIFVIGYIGSIYFFSSILGFIDQLMMKIPMLNLLYSYVQESTTGFIEKLDDPVLVELNYHGKPVYKVGFITQRNLSVLSLGQDEVAVWLPEAYGFAGEFRIFPKTLTRSLNISTTEALRLVVTGGLARIKGQPSPLPTKKNDK